jgi:exopolysaccharide biosynthesis WecB/TagA/CpsF family protein
VRVSIVDYDRAVAFVVDAARRRESRTVSALAVHGVMTGVLDREHRARLNRFDMLTPDGQPVRWALNLLARAGLRDRVYGAELTLRLCRAAAVAGVPIYLYGSRAEVVERMARRLGEQFPELRIADVQPSRFREATPEEDEDDVRRINASGAGIVFVGLGCPRQERWAAEHAGRVNAVMVCVGAAFDFHAGTVRQAPRLLQRLGLEWLFRLALEPRRLWKRYLLLNPAFVALLAAQALGVWRPPADGAQGAGSLPARG